MEQRKLLVNIIEKAIEEGIEYKEEMYSLGRGCDFSSVAELAVREYERALAETKSELEGLFLHGVMRNVCPDCKGYGNVMGGIDCNEKCKRCNGTGEITP